MKILKLFLVPLTAMVLSSCGGNKTAEEKSESVVEICETEEDVSADSDLIKMVYGTFVFAIDADPEVYGRPENFFTENALRKLAARYEFDCYNEDCFAYNEMRTSEQDSKPDTGGESYIISIEPIGENWHSVTYSDMGWEGMTIVKITDGKIDDFERVQE